MFNHVVQKKVMNQMGEVNNIIKFTGGKTKELIKSCIHLPHETGYENVMMLLNILIICLYHTRKN